MLFFFYNLSKKITLVYIGILYGGIFLPPLVKIIMSTCPIFMSSCQIPYYVDFSDPYVDLSAFYVDL